MFTTGSGSDFVGNKPAISGFQRVLQWFREPAGGQLGTTVTAALMNDALDNIRQAATNAGIDLTDTNRTIGDNQVLTEIIRNLGALSATAAVNVAHTVVATKGPTPMFWRRIGTSNFWTPVNAANTALDLEGMLQSSTLVLDNTSRVASTLVQGEFFGNFDCTLAVVSSTGGFTNKTLADTDINKAVYLVVIDDDFRYCLFEDIHPNYHYNARQVGVVHGRSTNTATVSFNTLIQPELRVKQKRIWTGNATSGTQTLVNESFSEWSQIIMYTGLDNRGTSPSLHTQPITIPMPIFVRGDAWIGTQESHAADAFLRIRYTSPTTFQVYAHTGNLSTGIREIWGVK